MRKWSRLDSIADGLSANCLIHLAIAAVAVDYCLFLSDCDYDTSLRNFQWKEGAIYSEVYCQTFGKKGSLPIYMFIYR